MTAIALIAAIFFGDVDVQHPPTESSYPRTVFDDLADCESGEWLGGGKFVRGSARWDITGTIHSGGLQWVSSTWLDVKPDGAPDDPAEASRRQEMAAAETLLSRPWGGWHHWPVCSRLIGVRP